MKKVLCFLSCFLFTFCSYSFAATSYFTSNCVGNGYVIGSDSNNGTSKSTPFLTNSKFFTTSVTNGDSLTVNNCGTPYIENTASVGYLDISGIRIWSWSTDATALAAFGKAVIQSSGAGRVVNTSGSTNTITVNDIIFDSQNTSGKASWTPHGAVLAFNRSEFQNVPSNAYGFDSGSTNENWTFDKCNFATGMAGGSMRYSSTSDATGGFVFKGTALASGALAAINAPATSSSTLGTIQVTKSSDGTRSSIVGTSTSVPMIYLSSSASSTITTIDIEYTDFSGSYQAAYYDPTGSVNTITGFTFANNTITGNNGLQPIYMGATSSGVSIHDNTSTATAGFCDLFGEGTNNISIYNNTITNTQNNEDVLLVQNAASAVDIHNNTVNFNAVSGRAIAVGPDGMATMAQNPTGNTGNQKIGDSSGDTYVFQSFTQGDGSSSSFFSYVGTILLPLAKVGTPTGTLTGYLYDDNAGVPGNLLATSRNAFDVSTLTGSVVTVEFDFISHGGALSKSTKYHVGVKFNGTGDASNYINVQTNSAFSGGNSTTSADGVSWTTNATDLLFYVQGGPFQLSTGVTVHDNKVVSSLATYLPHGVFIGNTSGGSMYRNLVLGAGLGLVLKNNTATPATLLMYDNLVYVYAGTFEALRVKAVTGASLYQNEAIVINAAAWAEAIDQGSNSGFSTVVNQNYSTNIVSKNNIIYRTAASISNPVYENPAGAGQNSNITIDNDVVYAGANTTIENTYTTWGTWQGAGYDTHGINADPLLTNETNPSSASDFIPLLTSPARGIGANTNGAVTNDYLGIAFPLTPDAGSYSINAYYISGGQNKIYFNPFVNNFDYIGLTSGTGNLIYDPLRVTSNLTGSATLPATLSNYTVNVNATSGPATITLPTAVGVSGYRATINKVDASANAVTVATTSAQTINGASTLVINNQYNSYTVVSDGANWQVVVNDTPILPNGNVGIGTISPTSLLDVGGNMYLDRSTSQIIMKDATGGTCTKINTQSGVVNGASVSCP